MIKEKENEIIVAVTGASGYIASHVVKYLLEKGYTVRGSVRDIKNKEKVSHLKLLFDNNPKFSLFEADLLKDGSFDTMFKGVHFVIHTASPFLLSCEDPQRDLVIPAVRGTSNVLISALKSGNVKRIVVTSSCAAIIWQQKHPKGAEKIWTEEDWNEDSTLTESPYELSKVEAEKMAWKLIKKYGGGYTDLVVINPEFVVGPPLSTRTDSTSVQIIKKLMDGTDKASGGFSNECFGYVDVRDVALAHILAIEIKEAGGKRFILSSEEGVDMSEYATILKDDNEFKDFLYPTKFKEPVIMRYKYSHKQAETILGIKFTPLETSLKDMARFLVTNGIVSKTKKQNCRL